MPEFTSYDAGTPSWVDHAAKNIETSNTFYGGLFGWEPEDQGEQMGHYTLLRKGGKTVAGNMPVMHEAQPSVWVNYVSVDDADLTVERARKAGAVVFAEPMDVSDIGRMAVFADPTGAALGIWQPVQHPGADLVNEPGSLVWNELNTRDTEVAIPFYAEVFGWGSNTNPMGELGAYTEWTMGDRTLGGMLPMPAALPDEVPAFWLVYFAVGDCDQAAATAADLGATVMQPPMDIPPGRMAVITDPVGATFALLALAAHPQP